MLNDGELAIFSQVETKFQNAAMTMAKLLATNMYLQNINGGRVKHLDGFQQWYDDGTNFPTIGGINRADVQTVGTVGGLNAYYANVTTFNLTTLNTAYGNAWYGNDHPDLICATQPGWNLIWGAIQPNQRYYDKDSDVGIAGFQAFRFNGAEVVVDKYMPTGATNGMMLGVNTKYIEWYFSQNKKFQFGFTGFKEANNTIDVAGQFLVGSNIVVPNPRTGFRLTSTTGLF